MAVLYALLRGEKVARERDEFARLLGKHDEWLSGKNFLLVPFHLIGAKSLEQKVLGGYVEHIRRLHPDAPIPAVHRTDALLESARYQRKTMGDAAFIGGLPGSDDEWGDEEAWTSQQLDAAFAAPPDDDGRQNLVNDLLQTWNQGFFTNAQEDAEGFVSLDRGLTHRRSPRRERHRPPRPGPAGTYARWGPGTDRSAGFGGRRDGAGHPAGSAPPTAGSRSGRRCR